jgi:hypothetical protein
MRARAHWLRIVVAWGVVFSIASTAASVGAPVAAAQVCIVAGSDAGGTLVERRDCRAARTVRATASAPSAEPVLKRQWRARATRPYARVLPRVLVERPYLRNCVLLR